MYCNSSTNTEQDGCDKVVAAHLGDRTAAKARALTCGHLQKSTINRESANG